ncbi:MAG: RDD family protein [Uliginosibacterium sp.]|nr:RDD family protein [Uliginosibacterium sp.]
MLDTLSSVTTPELIEVELHPAGLLPRALAWLIDTSIRFAVLLLLAQILLALGDFGTGLFLLDYFLLEWFYPVLFEVLNSGASPGKRTLGLAVVLADGTPIGWGPSLTRNLLRTVDFLPLLYVFGILSMLFDKEFRRLGDIVAGTLVVHRGAERKKAAVMTPADVLIPATPMDRATQKALVAFAERADSLTPARQEELAALLPHLALAASGPRGAGRLIGLANHVIGRSA